MLIVIGAWWTISGRRRCRSVISSRKAVALAAVYLLASLVVALSWEVKSLEAVMPKFVADRIYPIDKSNLDVLRLMHFLAKLLSHRKSFQATGQESIRLWLWPQSTAVETRLNCIA